MEDFKELDYAPKSFSKGRRIISILKKGHSVEVTLNELM
ncbi:hypothetical protein LSPCS325_14910 [Lysinibacillus sp. CTST325]